MNPYAGFRVFALALFLVLSPFPRIAVSTSQSANPVSQVSSARRPFRMLVLGDSVMWGQGLKDENKFSYKVREWICEQRNGGQCLNPNDVEIHVEAHSGAIIKLRNVFQKHQERECLRKESPPYCRGEIPNPYPSVTNQVELALRYYKDKGTSPDEIDLILLDGGINDLRAARIVLPFWGGNISKQVEESFHQPMRDLLDLVAQEFKTARIIVSGYFPLVTAGTPPDVLEEAIKDAFHDENKEESSLQLKLLSKVLKLDIEALTERSRQFVDSSNAALNTAVNEFNKGKAPLQLPQGASTAPVEASQRAVFVPVNFGQSNGYGAKSTFLWRLGKRGSSFKLACPQQRLLGKLLKDLIVDDQQQEERPCYCQRADRLDGKHGVPCVRAATFHPNIDGAAEYAKAIESHLGNISQFTGWK